MATEESIETNNLAGATTSMVTSAFDTVKSFGFGVFRFLTSKFTYSLGGGLFGPGPVDWTLPGPAVKVPGNDLYELIDGTTFLVPLLFLVYINFLNKNNSHFGTSRYSNPSIAPEVSGSRPVGWWKPRRAQA